MFFANLLARGATIVLAATAVALVSQASRSQTPRDPSLWPFASSSEWNHPIGSLAEYSSDADPMTLDLLAGGTEIHAGVWSQPIYQAQETDPVVKVYDTENKRTFAVNVPSTATPSPDTDAHMYVIAPSKETDLEMYDAVRNADGSITAKRTAWVNLYGDGMHLTGGTYPGVRAMDASGLGGLIRVWELKAGYMNHALTFMLPPSRMKHGPVWPSAREDYWGFVEYTGNVPVGSLMALPASVDIGKLGLTPDGLSLARTLRDFGAYLDDQAGSNGVVISAEQAAEGMPQLTNMRNDFNKIHPYLRIIMNNTASSVGGGGVPYEFPAPPLQPAP